MLALKDAFQDYFKHIQDTTFVWYKGETCFSKQTDIQLGVGSSH